MPRVDVMKLVRQHERNNEIAAQIILGDPARYQGIQLVWAETWRSHHKPQIDFGFEVKEPKVNKLPDGAREAYSRFCHQARTMGYKPTYAMARFRAAYGQWPPREWGRVL